MNYIYTKYVLVAIELIGEFSSYTSCKILKRNYFCEVAFWHFDSLSLTSFQLNNYIILGLWLQNKRISGMIHLLAVYWFDFEITKRLHGSQSPVHSGGTPGLQLRFLLHKIRLWVAQTQLVSNTNQTCEKQNMLTERAAQTENN